MTPEQFEKLPKRIQGEITEMRTLIGRQAEEIKWFKDENRIKVEASNTVVTQGIGHDTAILPFANVDFHITDPKKTRWKSAVTVRVRQDGASIEVCGTDSIVVAPQASNVVVITLREP